MNRLAKTVTFAAGAAAVTGVILQRTGKLRKRKPGQSGRIRVIKTAHGPTAIFAIGKIPPDSAPEWMRKIGSAVFARGAGYLYEHRKKSF